MVHFATAVRRLLRQPAFALLALFTLAVGLGANAAIFSVVDSILLRPLAYPQVERLVALDHQAPGLGLPELNLSEPLYLHYRDHARSFDRVGIFTEEPMAVSGLAQPVRAEGARLSPSLFEMLGVEPVLGRVFTADEGELGGDPVALISQTFWQRELGGDPRVLGRALTIDGSSFTVAGVLPADFDFPVPGVDLYLPYIIDPATLALGDFGVRALGRLAEGVAPEQATAELTAFTSNLESIFPESPAAPVLAGGEFAPLLLSLQERVVGDVGPVLWVLLATVGFVLLLATVNVATLFLARAERRQRETAIRSALGAGRGDLMKASLLEGMVLSLAAGAVGLVLARYGLDLLLRLAPQGSLPRAHEVTLDGRTVAVVAALSVVSGVVFSLIPLFRARLGELASQLKDGGRSTTLGQRRHRVRRAMVAAQMAIAVVLLVGAGLMVRSFERLAAVEPGFEADGRLAFTLALPSDRTGDDMATARFYADLLERLEAIPGVTDAVSATAMPLSNYRSLSGHRSRVEQERGGDVMPTMVNLHHVSPVFFQAMGIPVIEGRALERADFENRTRAVVVSQRLADLKWPGESAIGQEIFPGNPDEDTPWFEVVGVVGDVRFFSLTDEAPYQAYYPWTAPEENFWTVQRQSFVLRTESDPAAVMEAARRAVWSLDPDLPVAEAQTLDSLVRDARAATGFTTLMLLIAAGVAVLLGAVGTYGLISFLAAERRGEIGIRLALGAGRADVLRLVVREGLVLAAVGGAVGLVAAAALARGLDAMLFEVTPYDPATFLLVPVVLLTVAGLASALPASRAAALDPVEALQGD